ncbi:MAG TPA: hypothetical protein PKG95_00710 [Anaerolineaceae bacterium]|jgi:hypothetical protein|nr:hypothetical protein [Anaerolineaceae bacterium]
MEKIKSLFSNPLYAGILGAVIGLILGLIIAWGIWPVEYVDAYPANLRADYQQDYLCMVIDSFGQDPTRGDIAVGRYGGLGEVGPKILAEMNGSSCPGVGEADIAAFRTVVGAAQPVLTQAPATGETVVPTTPPTDASPKPFGLGWVIVLCLGTLIVLGILLYMLILKPRKRSTAGPSVVEQAQEIARNAVPTDFSAQGHEPPVAQFMTTYMIGDDLYDDSFSIDSPTGEFLGECGVGISESIGVGDPKKVTAFEVWLFDKNDISTVTKVLMSAHAFDDENMRSMLAAKGEPVLVEPGRRVQLETKTLILEARVVDTNYGQSALPAESFFDRLTLELAIWPKPAA